MAATGHIAVTCPHCKQELPQEIANQGKSVLSCPACQREFPAPPPRSHWIAAHEATGAATDQNAAVEGALREGPPPAAPEGPPIEFVEVAGSSEPTEPAGEMLDPDGPEVAQMIQEMIREGLRLGASRILLMPMKDRLKVVYRIQDAVLARGDPPPSMLYPILVRLMTMADLSGCFKVFVGNGERKLRTSFKPARHGVSATIEIAQDASVAEVCRARAAKLGYHFVDLDKQQILPVVIDAVPEQVARENEILPVSLEGGTLTIAIDDPRAEDSLDRLRFVLNRPIAVAMAPQGAILAAIDRYYGPSDPEAADVTLWELAQPPSADAETAVPSALQAEQAATAGDDPVVGPFLGLLRAMYRDKMLDLFEELRHGAKLCRSDPETGDLEVVFSHAHVMALLPEEARGYVENKIWALREAIISRLEHFLQRDDVARRVAMSYGLYLACCHLAGGRPASINPVTAIDAWVNFLYAVVTHSFPAIQSNGALLKFVSERPGELSAKIASLLDDNLYVVDPPSSRRWLARLESQTTIDEPVDLDSPPLIHLVELLIAEAAHIGASRMLLLPREDHVEVACRVQNAVYARKTLPLRLLYPLVARLRMLADASGTARMAVGDRQCRLHVVFHCTENGPAARIEITPDEEAIAACKAEDDRLGYPFVDLGDVEVPPTLLRHIPKGIAWKKKVLPLSLEDATLIVAVGAPPKRRRLDELRLVFNRPISVVMAPESEILAAIYRHYHPVEQEQPASPAAVALLRR